MNPDLEPEPEAELRECAACRRYATLTRYAVGIGNPFNRGLVEC